MDVSTTLIRASVYRERTGSGKWLVAMVFTGPSSDMVEHEYLFGSGKLDIGELTTQAEVAEARGREIVAAREAKLVAQLAAVAS